MPSSLVEEVAVARAVVVASGGSMVAEGTRLRLAM